MVAQRPELGRPEPFDLPPRQRLRLENGMRATLVQAGSVPKASVRLVLHTGGIDEAPDETWLSRLVAEYFKEGTEARTGQELADAVAALGGDLQTDADDDTMTLQASVLSEFAPQLIALLGEVVRRPAIPERELPRLRADLVRHADLARARPQFLALARFRAALYGDHPYGRVIPRRELLEAFDSDAARRFHQEQSGAARAFLYVAGRFDASAVEEAIREAFGDWDAGSPPSDREPSPRSERAIHLVDRPGAEQSTIYVGRPVPGPLDPDWIALWVMNALLGGSFYSRITLNLREDKGYTYSPRSVLSLRRRDASWIQTADVTTAHTGASLTEIFNEIEALHSEKPPPDELEGIQRYVAGSHLLRYATPAGIIEQLGFLDLQGLPDAFAESFILRAYAVLPAELQSIAMKHFTPETMTIAVVGDASVITEQLEPFGPIHRSDPEG